ncbi:MAG: hypothetical protein FWF18_05215 [Dehalococcoidia bacterium]|nr:hypothetical protein [Dehalococcoidia bacterium]
MKTLTLIAIFVCAFSVISAGCVRPDAGETVLPIDETEVLKNVSLVLEKDIYFVGDDSIIGVLKNDTDLFFQRPIGNVGILEKKIDGRWERIERIDLTVPSPVIPLITYLEPYSQANWGFSPNAWCGGLESGNYRVSTLLKDPPSDFRKFIVDGAISTTSIPTATPSRLGDFWVYAEFEIV